MPRVHLVQKNRKQFTCGRCREAIEPGAGYRHWKFRYGGKVVRCLNCPPPRASELTQSAHKSTAYAAQEAWQDAQPEILKLTDPEAYHDAMQTALESLQEGAREVYDGYEEALDQWEHGNAMLEEYRDMADEWMNELENIYLDDPPYTAEDLADIDDEDERESAEQENTEWREACMTLIEDAADNLNL